MKILLSLSPALANDSDGTIVSYLWQQVSGTSVAINNSDQTNAGFTAPDIDQDEVLTFSLTVTDNNGASSSDNVSITINHVNLLPNVHIAQNMTG